MATATPVVPLLVCVRAAYQTNQMAKDIGFFCCYMGSLVFSHGIPEAEFDAMVAEFGLAITQHDGPLESVTSFFMKTLRRQPPLSPPFREEIPWYRRQAARFSALAELVLEFEALSTGAVAGTARRSLFNAFRARARHLVEWETVEGW